jgi:glycosyltransferase involved in cell wall biosynthesis
MKNFRVFFLVLCFLSTDITAKIRLITFHYNRPDFLELQIELFKKFMVDDYELLVFNDAPNLENEKAIRDLCEANDIRCIRYEQAWHFQEPLTKTVHGWVNDPIFQRAYLGIYKGDSFEKVASSVSVRHSNVIQFALNLVGYDHDDIVAIVDGDLFPIQPIKLREMMKDSDLLGPIRKVDEADYIWVTFIAADMRTLPNKRELKCHLDFIDNKVYDTGSQTHYYLKNNPSARISRHKIYGSAFEPLSTPELIQLPFSRKEKLLMRRLLRMTNVEFQLGFRFMHFSGSSWDTAPRIKTRLTKELLSTLLNSENLIEEERP